MSDTPRTFQAVNESKRVWLGDPVARECKRLERQCSDQQQRIRRLEIAEEVLAWVIVALLIAVIVGWCL